MYRRPLALLIGNAVVMAVVAVAVDLSNGDVQFLDPDSSFLGPTWLRLPLLLAAAVLVDLVPRALWTSRLRVVQVPGLAKERWKTHWTKERITLVAAGILCFYVVYVSYRNLKSWLPKLFPDEKFDHELHLLDRAMFFGHEPGNVFHSVLGTGWVAWPLSLIYLWFLPLVPIAVVAWIVWSPSLRFGYWFVAADCLTWSLGTLSYYALPTLGPGIEYAHVYSDLPHTPTTDLMASIVNARQDYLWMGQHDILNSVAGFASLHCAITLLTALMVQYTLQNRWLHRLAWANFAITVVATIYFGWHYVADDIAGIMIALVAFYIAGVASGYRFGPKPDRKKPVHLTAAPVGAVDDSVGLSPPAQ
ncbi:MAG: phosphatase PAP2 family protein [Nocardioides sp.]